VADEVIAALAPADRSRVLVRATSGPVAVGPSARTDSTVRAAVAAVAEGRADAVVSAGASGASVAAAALLLGRWPDCRRPALAASLPAVSGPVVLLDVGASPDAGPAALARHAVLGAAYAAVLHAIVAPRIGLLSIGSEPGKGDRMRRAASGLLAAAWLPGAARYIGLVEGQEPCLGSSADVVVTDGFTGNVLLKGIEGAYAMAGGRESAGVVPHAAALLGVAGTVVVCHGAATGVDLASGIALAANLHRRAAMAAIATMIGVAPSRNVASGAHEPPR
jgi:glycerol-3-phosphate acyltransferase PlsX